MADNPAASVADGADGGEPHVTVNIKSGTDQKHTLTIPLGTTVGDLKAKLSTSEFADVPVDRQRLIFSGRILKDHDTLEAVKVKDGNTIHLVKSAASNARQNPANASSSRPDTAAAGTGAAPAVPNMAAGTGNSPFAQLTGARHAGFHGLPDPGVFGPDGGMGAPPDPDSLLNMLENPMFVSQMNEMMNNPQMMDMLLNSPQVRNNPQARMMLQNPEFRRLMLNPDMIRMQLQMQRAFQGGGGSTFAMPGETDTTAQTGAGQAGGNTQQQGQQASPPNPLSMFAQGAGGQGNPFAALFGAPPQTAGQTAATTSPPSTGAETEGTRADPTAAPARQPSGAANGGQANPFASLFGGQGGDQNDNAFTRMTQQMMQNPEMMRAAMNMATGLMGGGRGTQGGLPTGAEPGQQQQGQQQQQQQLQQQPNPFAGLFNPWAAGAMGGGGLVGSPEPPDSRPPEERYAEQLRQLNDMGFFEFDRNVQALRRSGGNVEGAVEDLLSNS